HEDSVNMDGVGILIAMKRSIYLIGQFFTDPRRFSIFGGAGAGQFLQTAVLSQQLLSALRPNTGNAVQRRGIAGLAAALTVSGNGETVGLVADVLDKVKRRRVPR